MHRLALIEFYVGLRDHYVRNAFKFIRVCHQTLRDHVHSDSSITANRSGRIFSF